MRHQGRHVLHYELSCAAGYMYCNLPGLEAREGQRIRIYYMSLGSEVDLHTPSLAGASQVRPTIIRRDLAHLVCGQQAHSFLVHHLHASATCFAIGWRNKR